MKLVLNVVAVLVAVSVTACSGTCLLYVTTPLTVTFTVTRAP